MDLAQLRAVLAVAEELHFGKAAEKLNIAQPHLSRTIKQLEGELGTLLFERSTRSVRLTSGGRALVESGRAVLEAVRRAEAAVHAAAQGEAGLIRIAFAGLSTHALVAALARRVKADLPLIQLELSSQNFAQPAMRKLLTGETDLALGRWDAVPPGITARVVMKDSLVVALPDTHALAGARHLPISRLAEEAFVSLPPQEGAVLTDRLRRLAEDSGFVPNVAQIAPDTQTALALVSAEVGCHLTLASVARSACDPHVAFVPLEAEALDVHLRAAWRTEDASSALNAVIRMLTDATDGDAW